MDESKIVDEYLDNTKNDKHKTTNSAYREPAKAAGYGLVKYASQQLGVGNFDLCMKFCKGGVFKMWIVDRTGVQYGNEVVIKDEDEEFGNK